MITVSRRNALLVGAGILGAGTGAILSLRTFDPAERRVPPLAPGRKRWSNWSGLQSCEPANIIVPESVEALSNALPTVATPIRPVGAGHSFTPLVPTTGTIVSLDRLHKVELDSEFVATVGTGTRLYALGEALEQKGASLEALPDINRQTLAGAISTATHGTGIAFGSLSEIIQELTLVKADGTTLRCNTESNTDAFHAARVSLGALGVLVEAKLRAVPIFKLKRNTWFEPVEQTIDTALQKAQQHRHFEFYYVTFTGMAYCISHDLTSEPISPVQQNPENDSVEDLMTLRNWLSWAPSLRKMVAQDMIRNEPSETRVGVPWRILSTDRPRRFNEMEFHLPREAIGTCLREIITAIERHNEVYYPIEVRFIGKDTAWLSPFYERESASIAVHMGHTQNHDFYYSEIEPIFLKHGGRPHWGKLHSRTAADFATMYPKWKQFLEIRNELDPKGHFLNAHLKSLFETAT